MEEILASIRRIISEDDTPAEADAAPAEPPAVAEAAPEPAPHVEPVADAAPESAPEPAPVEPEHIAAAAPVVAAPQPIEEEALELTEKVETHGDLDVFASEPAPAPKVESLVSDHIASAAASAFGALSAAVTMPKGERTLEDVVRELLRPLLQQWLDAHLPGIVQQTVEAEVDRIARGRVR